LPKSASPEVVAAVVDAVVAAEAVAVAVATVTTAAAAAERAETATVETEAQDTVVVDAGAAAAVATEAVATTTGSWASRLAKTAVAPSGGRPFFVAVQVVGNVLEKLSRCAQ